MNWQVPVNRWTVGAVVVILSIFGGDFIAPLMKVLSVMTAAYQPAL